MSLVMDLVLNRMYQAQVGPPRPRRRAALPRLLLHLPRPHRARRLRGHLPEVFPDFAPGNHAWDDAAGGWVWTTFNSFQWDVNWTNPAVAGGVRRHSMATWPTGVLECHRLDAIAAFMWKRKGTNCQGQSEVHAMPGPQGPHPHRHPGPRPQGRGDRGSYRARSSTWGRDGTPSKVCDLAYHNSLMVQIPGRCSPPRTSAWPPTPWRGLLPALHRHLDHLHPLPRRHRLGHR